jgi:hypothetical protein
MGPRKSSHAGYIELKDQEDDPRASINSSSPILPKSFENDGAELPLTATTFETNGLEDQFRPIDGYEGSHRYDPEFLWHSDEEKAVVWKASSLSSFHIS